MFQLGPLDKGLPDGANYNTSFDIVSDDVPSNVSPLSSSLQCTTSNGTIIPVFQTTYSRNFVVIYVFSRLSLSNPQAF